VKISYDKSYNQFYLVASIKYESLEDQEAAVGLFDDKGNLSILPIFTTTISFSLTDLKKLAKFMQNIENAKVCIAVDCKKKFVPEKKDQMYCSPKCRKRAFAQRQRR